MNVSQIREKQLHCLKKRPRLRWRGVNAHTLHDILQILEKERKKRILTSLNISKGTPLKGGNDDLRDGIFLNTVFSMNLRNLSA